MRSNSRRVPAFTGFMPRPPGLHRATHKRLLREHERVTRQIDALPARVLWPVGRKRLRTQFENRLLRIRRRLGLRVPHPAAKKRYRVGEAAALAGVSPKTLLRWSARGLIHCERSAAGHRYFARRDVLGIVGRLRL